MNESNGKFPVYEIAVSYWVGAKRADNPLVTFWRKGRLNDRCAYATQSTLNRISKLLSQGNLRVEYTHLWKEKIIVVYKPN